MRRAVLCCLLFAPRLLYGQAAGPAPLAPLVVTEEIGLTMNKAQVMEAVKQAWSISFGQEPGAKWMRTDEESATLEGMARVNYRSKVLTYREETLGSITYSVTIQARNGQCDLRVHSFRHTGNRQAVDGGLDMGVLFEGAGPVEHYPGLGLSLSRKLHADARTAASARVQEMIRVFSARLRLLAGHQ